MGDIYTFVWRIENFSFCFPRTGDRLKSPIFSCGECHFMKWSLSLYPRGRRKADLIDVRLVREDDIEHDLSVELELSVLNAVGLAAHKTQRTKGVFPSNAETAFSLSREEVQRRSNAYLPGDVLTLQVRFWPDDSYGDRLTVFATTVVRVERWSFPLMLEDFSDFEKDTEFSISVNSAVNECPGFKFKLCPDRKGDDYVGIRILPNSTERDHFVRCRISLMSTNYTVVEAMEDEQWFHRYRVKQPWTFRPFILKDKLLKNKLILLPKDVLTLRVELSVSLGEWKTSSTVKPMKSLSNSTVAVQTESIPSGALQSDLKSLYRNTILCDFTLKVKSRTFPVHKSILAARSPVFKAMFQKGMVNDKLTLRDTDPDILERLLSFAYGEELGDLDWESNVKLYSTADKYHLLDLKEICKGKLKMALDASNAWEVLLLADKHLDEDLRKTVQEFILEKEKSMIASEEGSIEEEGKEPLTLHDVCLKLKSNSQTVST